MNLRNAISFLIVVLSFSGFARADSPDVVDKIVATVNGHVILQSEWNEELGYEAVLSGRHLSDFNDEERKAALDRLIDQELLAEQMATATFARASQEEAEAKITEARKQNPAGSDGAWATSLAEFRLSEKDLVEHVRRQLDLTHLIDARLRPAIQIDASSVETYYREKFMPQLQQAGAAKVGLDEVSDRIRDLLTEQKLNELLVSWLRTLRSEGDVKLNEQGAGAQEIR